MTELIHSEEMSAGVKSIITATDAIPIAEASALKLEEKANLVRLNAENDRLTAFSEITTRLIELVESNSISMHEAVKVLAEVRDLDPRLVELYDGKKGDQIVSSFELLQPGSPIVNLPLHQKFPGIRAGIIAGLPSNVEIKPSIPSRQENYFKEQIVAPWSTLDIKIQTLSGVDQPEKVRFELESLRKATIGRAAISALIREVRLVTWHDTLFQSNLTDLEVLKYAISDLVRLGHEPYDISHLESEIAKYPNGTLRSHKHHPCGIY